MWGCSMSETRNSLAESPTAVASGEFLVPQQGQMLPIDATVVLGEETIELEVTQTPKQQAVGLMFRDSLPNNRGMLFSFDPARKVSFWMMNVKIPLDMLFVREGKIEAILSNVPPCEETPCPTYGPDTLIDSVIELRGGRAEELGVKTGDRAIVEFKE